MGSQLSIDYKVYCPSYRRSSTARSHKLFIPETFLYVVRESEFELYRKLETQILVIPEGLVSNIAQTRNWILQNKISNYVVQVDDDLSSIHRNVKRENIKQSPEQIDHFIQNAFLMAEDCMSGMWGINVNYDPKCYRIHTPLNFSYACLGPFSGFLDTEIRYDERLPLKEDYDIFLQHMNKYRKVLRFNYMNYSCDHQNMDGGCQTYRTSEEEIRQNNLLQQKWGKDLVRRNSINPGSINMIVRTGLGR